VIGDPFSANRCFAFGYFLPVNSKKADAGTGQRLLLAKCLPSDRKLKPWEGKGHRHQCDLVACGSHHRPGVVDPDVVGLRKIELALMARDPEVQSLHHLAVVGPPDVLFVVVAHLANLDWANRLAREAAIFMGHFMGPEIGPVDPPKLNAEISK
jgi:hypothetical protein